MELWQIWTIAALLLVIVEIFTTGFVVICFAFGGAVAAIAAACGLGIAWQVAFFAVATAATFFFIRPLMMRLFFRKEETVTNADAIIGREAIVTEAVDNAANTGRVKVDGDDWKAVSADSACYAAGEKVRIISRDGIIVTITNK